MISDRLTYSCKVVLLGEQSVGKSSLALRFAQNTFLQFHVPTIGAAYLTKTLSVNDCAIKFEIWDTAGQERFHSIAPMYYRGAKAAVVVYDITKHDSFIKAQKWVDELREKANPHLIIVLTGNKTDLGLNREVQNQKASNYAEEKNLSFIEASAKTNQNVEEIFHEIGKRFPKKSKPDKKPEEVSMTNSTPTRCC